MNHHSEILACIVNYDFSDSADHLKTSLSAYFDTYLIDSSSPTTPSLVDQIINNSYYPGLWNAAVKFAIDTHYKWIFFIASDVVVNDFGVLSSRLIHAISDETIGLYTPALVVGSRVYYSDTIHAGSNSLRDTEAIEGFCFLALVEILESLYPIPSTNKYGWGVDLVASRHAKERRFRVVVDDCVTIYHPPNREEHRIDTKYALLESLRYEEGASLNIADRAYLVARFFYRLAKRFTLSRRLE